MEEKPRPTSQSSTQPNVADAAGVDTVKTSNSFHEELDKFRNFLNTKKENSSTITIKDEAAVNGLSDPHQPLRLSKKPQARLCRASTNPLLPSPQVVKKNTSERRKSQHQRVYSLPESAVQLQVQLMKAVGKRKLGRGGKFSSPQEENGDKDKRDKECSIQYRLSSTLKKLDEKILEKEERNKDTDSSAACGESGGESFVAMDTNGNDVESFDDTMYDILDENDINDMPTLRLYSPYTAQPKKRRLGRRGFGRVVSCLFLQEEYDISPDLEEMVMNALAKKYRDRRYEEAAVKIQAHYRRYKLRQHYDKIRVRGVAGSPRTRAAHTSALASSYSNNDAMEAAGLKQQEFAHVHQALRYLEGEPCKRKLIKSAGSVNNAHDQASNTQEGCFIEGIFLKRRPSLSHAKAASKKKFNSIVVEERGCEEKKRKEKEEGEKEGVEREGVEQEEKGKEDINTTKNDTSTLSTEDTSLITPKEGSMSDVSTASRATKVKSENESFSNSKLAINQRSRRNTGTRGDDVPKYTAEVWERLLRLGVHKLNRHPKNGLAFLFSMGLVGETPQAVAAFFYRPQELHISKIVIGEYLGEPARFNQDVLYHLVHCMGFPGMPFDLALRHYLSHFRLPGEAQKIDRMMSVFSKRYYEQNPDGIIAPFADVDTAYILAYSCIMLNTDAHSPNVKRKMTKEGFIRNNRGINNGNDLPRDYLSQLYDGIVATQFKTVEDYVEEVKAIQGQMVGLTQNLVLPHRYLVAQGDFHEIYSFSTRYISSNPRRFVLFNDLLVLCRATRKGQLQVKQVLPLFGLKCLNMCNNYLYKQAFQLHNNEKLGAYTDLDRDSGAFSVGEDDDHPHSHYRDEDDGILYFKMKGMKEFTASLEEFIREATDMEDARMDRIDFLLGHIKGNATNEDERSYSTSEPSPMKVDDQIRIDAPDESDRESIRSATTPKQPPLRTKGTPSPRSLSIAKSWSKSVSSRRPLRTTSQLSLDGLSLFKGSNSNHRKALRTSSQMSLDTRSTKSLVTAKLRPVSDDNTESGETTGSGKDAYDMVDYPSTPELKVKERCRGGILNMHQQQCQSQASGLSILSWGSNDSPRPQQDSLAGASSKGSLWSANNLKEKIRSLVGLKKTRPKSMVNQAGSPASPRSFHTHDTVSLRSSAPSESGGSVRLPWSHGSTKHSSIDVQQQPKDDPSLESMIEDHNSLPHTSDR